MSNLKYDNNILSIKNIIITIISLIITFFLCKMKGKKRKKKAFKTFFKSFNFISELINSYSLKKKANEVKKDTSTIKIEKAEIIHL